MNKEYKLIWFVDDKNKFKNVHIKNVSFQNFLPKTPLEKLKWYYTFCTARAMLYDHRHLGKFFEKQILVFLRHGTFIKSRLKHANPTEENQSDLFVNTGRSFDRIDAEQLRLAPEKAIHTGFPNDDYLFDTKDYTKVIFPNEHFDKIILWMPTFRQNKQKTDSFQRIDSSFDFPLGLPCLYTKEDCMEVNRVLKENNILLVLMPHPAQDLSFIQEFQLDNFRILYDKDIEEKGIQLYQFLGSTDAMITDYSSVYYDYLLTDKSIGLTIDDYEVYAAETGFAVDYFKIIIGEYMKCKEDMVRYILSVAEGRDDLKEQRQKIKEFVYDYPDNHSTERVYNILMDTIKERYS
ncbi:MAG: CDP-glycerol glycerophosphotransferase family protein [Clostridia bacterium]|nr:CDP-glycerol glycerophosphotransferase family protein [Clostridia bacterium]